MSSLMPMRRLIAIVALVLAACSPDGVSVEAGAAHTTTTTLSNTSTTEPPAFAVTSPAFVDGGEIPSVYTCDGADLSPELNVVGIPVDTQSIVIIVDDFDAPLGRWDHWVEYDIPAGSGSFVIERDSTVLGVPGVNSWNLEGYMGPCPPPGESHTYHFRVFALDRLLDLPPGVGSEAVRSAINGTELGVVALTGTYAR